MATGAIKVKQEQEVQTPGCLHQYFRRSDSSSTLSMGPPQSDSETEQGRLTDTEAVKSLPSDTDTVMHAKREPATDAPEGSQETNVCAGSCIRAG